MPEKHLSRHYDSDLDKLLSEVLEMGGLVEAQLQMAIRAVDTLSLIYAEEVIATELRVNRMEIALDAHCSNLIARWQPAARDLRFLMSIPRAISNLERVGDEAYKIAKRAHRIIHNESRPAVEFPEIPRAAALALTLLSRALDNFARLDAVSAAEVVRDDRAIDNEYRGFVETIMSYMVENSRLTSMSLDYLFIGKALEKVGDHAKNIAELTIYIASGTDIRHSPQTVDVPESNKEFLRTTLP
ncbi:phosphate signaling complex protein PhoU [Cupriavidus basilensis]|uniref:phosphate signaling complex protein PhoU n=1 Tax=Cupriavidus basilensis TaxID=68895 RepID=UPI0005B7ACDD|nr:phosphate signaling complex protein PhoU [Cupriavidus basilensis]